MKQGLMLVIIAVASAALALLVFELCLRAIGYSAPLFYQPDPQLGWVLRPGVQGWFTQEGRSFVRINSAGMRDREHTVNKPAGVYRIAVLGDSYSEAMQVPAESTYWSLLPARLSQCGFQGQRIEVLSFGTSGYGTGQEYIALEAKAMRYRPDLVVLQFTSGNDVRNNSPALDPEKGRPFFVLSPDGALRLDDAFRASPRYRWLTSRAWRLFRKVSDYSRVAQLVNAAREKQLSRRAQAQGGSAAQAGLDSAGLVPPRDRRWEDAWQVTEDLIAQIHHYAAGHAAQMLLVTIAAGAQLHPDPRVREALQARLGVQDLRYPERRVESFAERHGIPVLSLGPEMAKAGKRYFHGFGDHLGTGHWNETGHRTAAEIIAGRLCEDASMNISAGSPRE